ncbi:phosphatase PAP2 family protein [Shewanella dokdonensis]|uniref:Phosphatase PAP2 family protein n=1 Tax=Shewanella dokdonensis TaxID=712036 RepID=A0ABX8DDS0_9GAMM|nr:phosphatase PAP2 family protein [Shewanella dokdonensis]MCL1073277.1 phosphatase PAP2 family protein [Shewanella dokdonensis]QVK22883.1 phosphatase PAP2 family protein [Shewanella dokdonensis]
MVTKSCAKVFVVSAVALALAACNSSNDDTTTYTNPGLPAGTSATHSVAEPVLSGNDIAVVDGNLPTTNNNGNIVAFDPSVSPLIQILSGFDDIWYAGDDTWAMTGSSESKAIAAGYEAYPGVVGGGTNSTSYAIPFNFSHEQIRNKSVWQENFNYVKQLVENSTKAEKVAAYLDDQRDKGFSISSGLGPMTADYQSGANATSSYSVNANGDVVLTDAVSGETHVIDIENTKYNGNLYESLANSTRTGFGSTSVDGEATALSDVVVLLQTVAAYGASTEAPKYHFESPRPWRINADDYSTVNVNDASASIYSTITDISALEEDACLGLDGQAVAAYKYYERPANPIVLPITGLLCAARTTYYGKDSDNDGVPNSFSEFEGDTKTAVNSLPALYSSRAKDGAFPSGHTAEAFDRGLIYAYAIPERFAEMVARAGDLGTDRIVAGMHSPLDVIGGRIMATAIAAAMLSDNNNALAAETAVEQAQKYFLTKAQTAGYDTVYDYAHCTTDVTKPCDLTDQYADRAAMKTRYRQSMTYGFTPLAEASAAPEVPKGAEVLLKTRFPYLDANQRRQVLATTEIDANYPVINKSRGWGRLNLVDAADGYAAFNSNVSIYMDANRGGFNAIDRWMNDISGDGRLEKSGSGTLYLTGTNSYRGGTVLEQGTLVASSASAFGNNTLYQKDGTVKISIGAGAETAAAGALTVTDFVMDGGVLALDLNRNAQLKATTGIYLTGNNLSLDLKVPPLTAATRYTVLNSQHLEGKFTEANIRATDASGTVYKVAMVYTDTSAQVTVTPKN